MKTLICVILMFAGCDWCAAQGSAGTYGEVHVVHASGGSHGSWGSRREDRKARRAARRASRGSYGSHSYGSAGSHSYGSAGSHSYGSAGQTGNVVAEVPPAEVAPCVGDQCQPEAQAAPQHSIIEHHSAAPFMQRGPARRLTGAGMRVVTYPMRRVVHAARYH